MFVINTVTKVVQQKKMKFLSRDIKNSQTSNTLNR